MKDNNKVTPRILAGFMELKPGEQILFNNYVDIIRQTYEAFGFAPLDTPGVELADVLLAKIGEDTKKEIYRFKRGDDEVALRFDLTVPLARYVAMYANNLVFPFRRYQIGKVYRGERPQKGRYREFYQCDIDIIGRGELSLINDAEILAVINTLFERLDFGDFVIRISNRKILNGLVGSLGWPDKTDEVLRIVDKIEKIGQQSVINELVSTGLSIGGAKKVIDFVKIQGSNSEIIKKLRGMKVVNTTFQVGVDELEEVVRRAMEFGVPEKNVRIDLSIARGLSYYTGTVYETKLMNEEINGSVCSGGRYDDLANSYTDTSYPGVGISIGLTRLFSQLISAGLIKSTKSTPAKVLIVSMDENQLAHALRVASDFRLAGIPTEVYTESEKFRKKLVYGNKTGVPYTVIVGPDEVQANKVTLKNMSSGEQETLKVQKAIEVIREAIVS